jgi:hypothetical protein
MQAYVSPIGAGDDDVKRIAVEERVGIYRDGRKIVAGVGSNTVDLGISDVTVSREKDAGAPVQLEPRNGAVAITNAGNTNGLTVDTGVERISIEEGSTREFIQDCTLEVGFNAEFQLSIEADDERTLSVDELQEKLDIEQERGVIEGVDPAAYVGSVASNLRREAEREATNECLKFANELVDFVEQRPLEDDVHEDIQDELDAISNGLERKVTHDSLKGSGLDEEWKDRIDRVTHRVENMYARGEF